MQETWFNLWVGKIPWSRKWYSCLENPMDWEAWLAMYSPWGHKESDTIERLTLFLISTEIKKLNIQTLVMVYSLKP